MADMQKSVDVAAATLAEQEAEVAALSVQVQQLAKEAPQAPEEASLSEKGAHFSVDVAAPGELLEQQGGGDNARDMARGLAANMAAQLAHKVSEARAQHAAGPTGAEAAEAKQGPTPAQVTAQSIIEKTKKYANGVPRIMMLRG